MARHSQKTGSFIKSARTSPPTAASPDYTLNQPASLIYSPVTSPAAVIKDQGGNVVPLVQTAVSRASKSPLALFGNGNVGVFEVGTVTKTARVRFTTYRVTATGKAAYGNAVAFTCPENLVSVTDTTGSSAVVGAGAGGAPATGHLVSDATTGVYDATFLFFTTGTKTIVLQFGNETFLLALNVV